jgi:hypothetical protein
MENSSIFQNKMLESLLVKQNKKNDFSEEYEVERAY